MQRVTHLRFGSSDRDVSLLAGTFQLSDFLLTSELLKLTKLICLPPDLGGATPRQDLYDRPLFRRRAPNVSDLSWSPSTVEWFPNALIATQDLIFESIVKQPQVSIDDISVATAVALCADGESPDAYDYIWAWQDDSERIKLFFEADSFNPCVGGPKMMSAKLLQQAVGRLAWATCGNGK